MFKAVIENVELKKEIETQDRQYELLLVKKNHLEKEIEKLNKHLEMLKETIEKLKEKNKKLRKEIKELKKEWS